ncbi:MAG: hydrogen gas-evolving membrane-bound hydrogenase subunit E [bacterium]|nr:hydrogen gas-evolving membrane-bound hydrogenase subunit E [bacterium]
MIQIVCLIVLFSLAILTPLVARQVRSDRQGMFLSLVLMALFGAFLLQLPAVTSGTAEQFSAGWMPQIGLSFSFMLDGLSLLFALVITGVGAAVMLYAGYYFDKPEESTRFFALIMAFTGSMLALVMAGNLITLFIAWEGTSILSFLLIGFKGKDQEARRSASQALMITGGGGLALLAGLLLLGSAAGSYELADIAASGEALQMHPWIGAILILIFIGCFTKSAQFPFHFWLPNAMSAPSPASAFLHSATMVKAGVYLLARLQPTLGDLPLWTTALPVFGLVTLGFGALVALRQTDLKGMLAYSTISQLGALVALIGLPESHGIKAAMVGILAHALYKGTLFLVVGAVDHAAETRDIRILGGLRRTLPGFAWVTLIAGLSMAGMPPLFGFVSKELMIEAVIQQPIALAVMGVSAALTVTLALRLYLEVFILPPRETALPAHEAHHLPRGMVIGPGVLAAASIVAGIGIAPLITPLVEPAVGTDTRLYLFPPEGINQAFLMSMLALAVGAGVFAIRRVWLAWRLPTLITGPQVYRAAVSGVESFGDLLLRSQNGKIRNYLMVILLSVLILIALPILILDRGLPIPPILLTTAADVLKAVLLILSLLATAASILLDRHLLAALALGAAGYAIGGIFLLEPAPDVALVQFLVETLATVLIIVILARTSTEERKRAISTLWGGVSRRGVWRDAALSAAIGAAVTTFALAAVSSRQGRTTIADWHLANALPQVGVNDVVAGIITDFRGTDTVIEISVFGIAALGVLTLLARPVPGRTRILIRRRRRRSDTQLKDALQEDAETPELLLYRSRFTNPVTQLAASIILPIAVLIALGHILYAGAAPGDGFTAGVIIGLGIALWFVVYGYEDTKRRLPWLHPTPLIGFGLTLALVNALLPVLFGRAFLAFTPVNGIDIAEIKIASTTLFEIAICLAVFGGISTIMEAISHPRECEPL